MTAEHDAARAYYIKLEGEKIALEQEIQKWRQQQKDDYDTYLQKVAEKDKEIQNLHIIYEQAQSEVEKLQELYDDAVADWGEVVTERNALSKRIGLAQQTLNEYPYEIGNSKWLERLRKILSEGNIETEAKKP